jgi:hypothetical protein
MGQLKRAFYARMEEVSFRSGAAVAGGVLTAAGVAITLAVVLGGHSDAAASAPASRVAVPSVTLPSPAPVSSSSSPSPTPRPHRTKDSAAAAGAYRPPSAIRASATRHPAAPTPGSTPTPRLLDPRSPASPGLPPGGWGNAPPPWPWPFGLLRHHTGGATATEAFSCDCESRRRMNLPLDPALGG